MGVKSPMGPACFIKKGNKKATMTAIHRLDAMPRKLHDPFSERWSQGVRNVL